ncbi:hypothetical protein ACJX0J_035469, partial [Zea mays]
IYFLHFFLSCLIHSSIRSGDPIIFRKNNENGQNNKNRQKTTSDLLFSMTMIRL